VLDVGCGSGLLARRLLDAGYAVMGIDASPAMIELARRYAPGASFSVKRLPLGAASGDRAGTFDAVVSTGHVLNYLDTRDDIAAALRDIAHVVRPGGVLAIDLVTDEFIERSDVGNVHAKVTDDWAIITRFALPEPHRLDRMITVFRRSGDQWRRSDEHHRNVTFDAVEALRILREAGFVAEQRAAFGTETLPPGLVVLAAIRRG
jgi:SAM-dependent methyltransferase